MRVQLVRLCVLYEDLKIEFEGSASDHIRELDRTDVNTRRFYFMRRTLATLTEAEQVIVTLNGNPTFKTLKSRMRPESVKSWDEGIKFFAKNHDFLKDWRNDIGGHSLTKIACYALEEMHEDTAGVLDLHRRGSGADIRMPFAYEFVAVALLRHKPAGQTDDDFLSEAFDFLKEAVQRAVAAAHVIVEAEILPKFSGG